MYCFVALPVQLKIKSLTFSSTYFSHFQYDLEIEITDTASFVVLNFCCDWSWEIMAKRLQWFLPKRNCGKKIFLFFWLLWNIFHTYEILKTKPNFINKLSYLELICLENITYINTISGSHTISSNQMCRIFHAEM